MELYKSPCLPHAVVDFRHGGRWIIVANTWEPGRDLESSKIPNDRLKSDN
jgi:hypothetical protein